AAKAEAEHESAEQASATADAAFATADEAVHVLEREQATLAGRIGQLDTLKGGETECPTCAQPLDAAACAHARERLAEERARLAAMERNLAEASAERDYAVHTRDAGRAVERTADKVLRAAQQKLAAAHTAVAE